MVFFPLDSRYCATLFHSFFASKLGLKSKKIKIIFGLPNCFVEDFFLTTEELKYYQAEQKACLHFESQNFCSLQEYEFYIKAFVQHRENQIYFGAVKKSFLDLFQAFFAELGKQCRVIYVPSPIAWLNYFKYMGQGRALDGTQYERQEVKAQFLLSRALAISGFIKD